MTDRHSGYVVTLEKEIRADDAQCLMQAIAMLKGVACVEPVVQDVGAQIAESKVRHELGKEIVRVIFPNAGQPK
jgi:hypothetical protein